MHVLTFNCGSSSLKYGVYRVDDLADRLLDGVVERDGTTTTTRARPLDRIDTVLDRAQLPQIDAVGHRIVHGGLHVRHDCVIDDDVMGALEQAVSFAPLHLPDALAAVRHARRRYPSIPQVACLDTAFHAHLDDVARRLPLPRSYDEAGIRRYGFHGLSCASIVRRLGDDVPQRLVIAHLGNGASVTAVRRGRSIDTTMGLTPAGGLMMGSRSGDLDPGVAIHLMRAHALDADSLEDLFERRSGLLGVSGLSSDMRTLRRASATHPDARLAIAMFCYGVRKQIGAMTAALGGIDALVFSGGIGAHDPQTRIDVCEGLAWLGITIDGPRNASPPGVVSTDASIVVRVVPSEEDEQIALASVAALAARTPGRRSGARA